MTDESTELDALEQFAANQKIQKIVREPRHYQPIWEKIKTERKCIVCVDPKLFPRVRKAITKEKWKDKAWTSKNRVQLKFKQAKTKQGVQVLVITLVLWINSASNF